MPTALLHGLPVLLVAVLIVLIYRRSAARRATYRLPQPWTHEPVLWTATDEVIPAGAHGSHGHHVRRDQGRDQITVGGGASGHW